MLKRGVNFLIHNLTRDDQGIYHIPADVSPEYKTDEGIPEIPDNNYNLGLLKWALGEALHLPVSVRYFLENSCYLLGWNG